LVLVRRAQDLADLIRRRASGESVLGGFIGLKGAHALQDGQEALQQFFDAGFRMIALTHRFNNRYSGASEGCPPNYELDSPAPEMGVTELGRRLLVAAANAGMLIDLAHASSATIKDVTTMPELAGHAMLISHTGVRLTCRPPQGHVARNITDDDIRAVARTGGVIGVGFWPEAVCWTDAEDVTQQERVDAILRAMAHIATVLASPEFATEMRARRPDYDPMDHIAFGSDFDGAVETPLDVGGMELLTASMLRYRDTNQQAVFDERAVRKIAGINVCRMLMTEQPALADRGETILDKLSHR
jgi:membrane dipeptidase